MEQRLIIPQDRCSKKIRTIIEMCWAHDPSDRPTFDVLAPLLAALFKAQLKLEEEEQSGDDEEEEDDDEEDDDEDDSEDDQARSR